MARLETTTGTRDTSYTFGGGVGAGIVAALAMGLFAMIVFAARGQGFFTPLELMGATLMREEALEWTFWAVLLGLGIHLVLGAIFGVIFAAFARGMRTMAMRVAAGLAYGAIIFLVMTYLVLPWANPWLMAAIEPGWFFLYHLAFGLVLPLALPSRAPAVYGRREPVPPRP